MTGPSHRLVESARLRTLHHAVILQGPSPKTLAATAIAIAKALNCRNGSEGDACPSCQKIDRQTHPDVHMLVPAKDRKAISIEQVRELVGEAGMRPYEGGTKVFIIDPADSLSGAAANSLLKTLEEPVPDTVFVLLTRSADMLLPTIRSRCQIVFLRPEHDDVQIADPGIALEVAERLAGFAESRDMSALLGIAPLLCKDDAKQGLALLAATLRDIAAGVTTGPAANVAATIPPSRLLDAARRAVEGIDALNVNADARLLVEDALMVLAGARQ
jgi:DNA polymerase III delta prime subunit